MTNRNDTAERSTADSPSRLRRVRLPLMIGGPLLVVVVAGWFWLTGGRYATTDDAFVQTGRVQISSNVSGHVVQLAVHENQRVHAGDLLFRIDPQSSDVSVLQAAARLNSAQAQVQADRASYRQRMSELKSAEQNLDYRRHELARDKGLLSSGVLSRQDYDEAAHEVDTAEQQVAALRNQLDVAAVSIGGSPEVPVANNSAVRQAAAELEQARLTQGDNIVRAPQDGVVTRVSQLQVGSYVQAAAPIFTLVTDEIWVDANFKEHDLTYMRPGQLATVKVDAYPQLKLQAKVQSLSPGTGSSFSLLPPENATGNWVKVVQRVPVRLVFTRPPPFPLQGGLSAVVKVDTQHRRLGGGSGAQ